MTKKIVFSLLLLALAVAVPVFLSNRIFARQSERIISMPQEFEEQLSLPAPQTSAAPFIIFNTDEQSDAAVVPPHP